jgi:hypothetical protein
MSEEYTEDPTPEQEGSELPPMAEGGVWMQHGGLPPVYVMGQTHIDRLFAEGAYIIDDPRTIEDASADDEQDSSDDTPTEDANAAPAVENRPARPRSHKRLTPVARPSDDIPALYGVPDVTVRQTGQHEQEDA